MDATMSDPATDKKNRFEIMKHELQIAKSTAVKLELEFKIAQCEEDILRLKAHQAQHEEIIAKSRAEIEKIKGGADGRQGP